MNTMIQIQAFNFQQISALHGSGHLLQVYQNVFTDTYGKNPSYKKGTFVQLNDVEKIEILFVFCWQSYYWQ